ncbi:DUF4112 domain-containing protein [Kordiimonas aestuarii]|uniref:DUF4112 domain-containing protein n=1 Tax=Kordiimonas aestuarii TaxID=1005925 RepID=UPI0021D37829|nr:DUF4112 domain-containing protein [Kordiimonas aestuarii]
MEETGHNRLNATDKQRARRIYRLARLLDNQFRLPVLGVRFGLDSILGLIPGAGDTVTAIMAAYIILEAWRLGVSKTTIAKMLGNLVLDWVIGSIPLIGDIFDLGFKANLRNICLLEKDLGTELKDL